MSHSRRHIKVEYDGRKKRVQITLLAIRRSFKILRAFPLNYIKLISIEEWNDPVEVPREIWSHIWYLVKSLVVVLDDPSTDSDTSSESTSRESSDRIERTGVQYITWCGCVKQIFGLTTPDTIIVDLKKLIVAQDISGVDNDIARFELFYMDSLLDCGTVGDLDLGPDSEMLTVEIHLDRL
ncbi:hypothetical protein RhiLY_09397 [Ceratobasidium sp. AG-Ba]|nr:hypothetical protein RhiLY_09397 [Ceratobasidium sp. AG-Ba]